MGIKDRIKKLEHDIPNNEDKGPGVLVVVTGGLSKEEADAKVKAAKAEYRAKHPDHAEDKINIICVIDEETKEMMEKVKERTRRLKT